MHSGTASKGNADCDNPIQQNVALGEKLAVTGTPTLFFASGKRVPGAIALDEITKQLGAQ
jgi:thiol:disulfide interchange protein DsbC